MNGRKVSRRAFLSASVLGAAGVMAAACAPKPTPVPVTPKDTPAGAATSQPPTPTTAPVSVKEPTTITYWTFWGGFEEMLDEWKATDAYKKFFDERNLRLDMASNVPKETFLANLAAGTPPDAGVRPGYLEFMVRGVVIPVDELLAASSLKADDFIEANLNLCSYKGSLYGIPANECFVRRGLCYNARMVAEAGLDPDKPPVTWPEVLEWHKALTKFDKAGNLVQIGLDPFDAEGGSFAWYNDGSFAAESWGVDWWDESTSTFRLNDPRLAEAFDTMGEFVKIIGPDNLAGFRGVAGQGGWGGAIESEVQAMIIEGYWAPGETAINAPEVSKVLRATWVPVPENRRGVKLQFAGGHMVQFFKDAKHPKEAFAVAEFLNTKEICDIIFKRNGWLPALKSYIATVDPSPYPGLDFYLKSVNEANEWWTGQPCEITEFVDAQYEPLIEKVYRGQMTGAEAAAEFQRLCEMEYKAQGYA